jgi:chemotaxis protein MotB
MSASGDNESGILVYPQLPVPPRRRGEPSVPAQRAPRPQRPRRSRLPLVALIAGALGGGAGGWFLRPAIAPDARIADAARRASEAEAAAASQKTRADALDKSLEAAGKARHDSDAKLAVAETAQAELAGKSADEAELRKSAEALQARLRAAVDRATGTAIADGGDVHIRLAAGALFKPNEDALTDHGKATLARLAAALKDVPDRQLLVQGHTDDAPIASPRPTPPPRGARSAPPPAVRFASNWELSAARALAVVHYFQDVARLDPSRLTALAFGQYAPLSKRDRSANRRIEIVVAARRPAKT